MNLKGLKITSFLLITFIFIFAALGINVTSKAQNQENIEREIDVNDIELLDGYAIEPYAINLSVPTTAIFDGEDMLIAESGYSNTAKPRVLRISQNGEVDVISEEGLNAPVTGLLVVEDQVYVSHRGKVSIIQEDGSLEDIVTDLPSEGDHQNNQIVLSPDGKIYMGQGTRTNSGVVGVDNFIFGWLPDHPDLHEVPCENITLTGQNFETENPLTDEDDTVQTGPYKSYGAQATESETIEGTDKCGGSIVRFNPDGSDFEIVAWGLRNPFGLAFDSNGQLWASYHGVDVRGSRPVFGDPDYLVQVQEGAWYGWPEYFDGQPITAERFDPPAPGEPTPEFIWQEHPTLTNAYMTFEPHSAVNGIAFSPGGNFGHEGDLFIAMFGSLAPITTGLEIEGSGFKVVKVNVVEKQTEDFATNTILGPAYINQTGGLDRPSDVVFGPDDALYVVDWGGTTVDEEGLKFVPETGLIWRIYNTENQTAIMQDGSINVSSAAIPLEQRETAVPNVLESYEEIGPQLFVILAILVVIIIIIYLIYRKAKNSN